MPNSALADVSESLRYLNLSHNQIQHLDSTMFAATLQLLSLGSPHQYRATYGSPYHISNIYPMWFFPNIVVYFTF